MTNEPEQPTAEQCNKRALVAEDEDEVRFATWHPQWGGYTGKCIVQIGKMTNNIGDSDYPGCFEVWNWHDGEFPSKDYVDEKHYCSPEQLIRFGVEILEKMMKYQRTKEGCRMVPRLDDLIERLQRLSNGQDNGFQKE